jgi:hypothetical protein
MVVFLVLTGADSVGVPNSVLAVFGKKGDAVEYAARPCGYEGGDLNKPVPSGNWVQKWEVE